MEQQQMTQNKIVLFIGLGLLAIGLIKPDLSQLRWNANVVPVSNLEQYVTDAPADANLVEKGRIVTKILLDSNDSTRKYNALRLSALYNDLATLISLDNDDMVIKDSSAIREANKLSGNMLNLDIKNKYPNLASANEDIVVTAIGDADVLLDAETRQRAIQAFRTLSWAFYEGSK